MRVRCLSARHVSLRSAGYRRCGAGKYLLGDKNTNDCPKGWLLIDSEAVCQAAAVVAGKTYVRSLTKSDLPRGCLWLTSGAYVYFNGDAVGGANGNYGPLCGTMAPALLAVSGEPTLVPSDAAGNSIVWPSLAPSPMRNATASTQTPAF